VEDILADDSIVESRSLERRPKIIKKTPKTSKQLSDWRTRRMMMVEGVVSGCSRVGRDISALLPPERSSTCINEA
jgi:hypothetical protein